VGDAAAGGGVDGEESHAATARSFEGCDLVCIMASRAGDIASFVTCARAEQGERESDEDVAAGRSIGHTDG
jgi:hypothetical protein